MTKKIKKNPEAEPLISDFEKRMAQMTLENAQLKQVNEETRKAMETLQTTIAQRRLTLNQIAAEAPEIEEAPPEEPLETGGAPALFESNSKFESTLRDFNSRSEGTIEIFRIKENGVEAKIGSFSVKDWGTSLEKCAKSYGGGEFKAVLRDENGHYRGNTVVYYDELAYPRPPAGAIGSAPQPAADLSDLVKTLHQQSEVQQDKTMAMFMKMMEVVNNRPQANPVGELENLIRLKKLMEPPQVESPSPLKDVSTLLSLFQKGVETGEKMAPRAETGGEGDFMSLLSMLAPAVAPALGRVLAKSTPPQELSKALDVIKEKAGVPAVPAAAVEITASPEVKDMDFKTKMILALYKGPLLDMAKNSFDAAKTAQMILLKVPEEHYSMALDLASAPNRLELVYGYIPELSSFAPWTESVLKEGAEILRQYFTEENGKAEENSAVVPENKTSAGPDKEFDYQAISEKSHAEKDKK
jgi:hypothetical protein